MEEYKQLIRDSFTANPSLEELWCASNGVSFATEAQAQTYCSSTNLAAPVKETPASVAA